MSRVGKIILDNNYTNPRVVIVDEPNCLRALDLTTNSDQRTTFQLKEEDVFRLKYRGSQLDGRSVDLTRVSAVYNLNIREIGLMSKDAYYRLIIKFNNYQNTLDGNTWDFLSVKEEIQGQIIELGKRLVK